MPLRRASTQQHALAPQLATKPKPTKKETKTKQKKTSNWEGGGHTHYTINQPTNAEAAGASAK